MQVFTEADFAVGKQCNINGCDFLIYGCDEFTRDYYEKVPRAQSVLRSPYTAGHRLSVPRASSTRSKGAPVITR